jgi:hypothetical protein
MTLSKNSITNHSLTLKDLGLSKQFYLKTLGLDPSETYLTSKTLKDLTIPGQIYVNSIQLEDYPVTPSTLTTQNFSLLPTYTELSELDESFKGYKGLIGLVDKSSNHLTGMYTSGLAPRSYLSVFNYFRSDFDDFT